VKVARWLRLCGILGLATGLYFVVPVDSHPPGGFVLRTGLSCLFFVVLATAVVVQIRLAAADSDRHVDGLIVVIAVVLFAFALGFYVMHLRRPGEVVGLSTRVDALYFVISTMLTVGFGDIHAEGQLARGVVIVQMLFDVLFIATSGALIRARMHDRAVERAANRPTGGEQRPRRSLSERRRRRKTPDPPVAG
jgi:voltage-gated potassium channel